jgi:hypothetical protein
MSQKIILIENNDDCNDTNDDKNIDDLNYFFNDIYLKISVLVF